MHRVGFEPTRFATVVLETTPLDHSGTDAHSLCRKTKVFRTEKIESGMNHVCQCVCWCVCVEEGYLRLEKCGKKSQSGRVCGRQCQSQGRVIEKKKKRVEMRGIDPRAPRMRSECSTI